MTLQKSDHQKSDPIVIWIAALFVVLGIFLRTVYVTDMEYKDDERMMVQAVQNYRTGQTGLESIGFHSGVGLRHPSFSVQIFQIAGKAFNLDTPTAVCRFVMVSNAVALVLLFLFALFRVESHWREAWLWGVGLLAVNPVALQLHRKIWAPSLLPICCALLLWISWTRKPKTLTFVLAGVLLSLMSQIHLSGFFFTAAIGFAALIYYPNQVSKNIKGVLLFFFSFLAAFFFSRDWVFYLFQNSQHEIYARPWKELFIPRTLFFWITEPFGFHIGSAVGSQSFFAANAKFFAYPQVGGISTYGVAVSYLVLLVLGLCFLGALYRGFFTKKQLFSRFFDRPQDPSSFFLRSVPLSLAILYEMSVSRIVRHYLLIVTPLMQVSVAAMVLHFQRNRARSVLFLMLFFQLILSASFLQFIHLNGGATEGDYGVSYLVQLEKASTRELK